MSGLFQSLLTMGPGISWIHDLVLPPEALGPLTWQSACTDLLPSPILYFLNAYLVLMPGTLPIRLTLLLPISLWSFFRAATHIDLVYGLRHREWLVYWNVGLVVALTCAAGRCISWSYQRVPYRRLYRIPGEKNTKLNQDSRVWDALDLCVNLRGHGWCWSHGLQVAPESRPTQSRRDFLITVLIHFFTYSIIADHIHWTVQWFGPTTIGSPYGGTIHHPPLSPLLDLLRSSILTSLTGLFICLNMEAAYNLFTLIGVGVFNQHPLQWPPLFDSPWLSSSLTELWAKRWHQIFRDMFIGVGARPLSLLIGRVGWIMGAFLVSSILHHFALWGAGRGTEFSSVGVYFLIQGLGVTLEHTWRYFTGRRVRGPVGRVWTFVWAVVWGQILLDGWSRRGLGASSLHQDRFRPSYFTLGPLPLPLA